MTGLVLFISGVLLLLPPGSRVRLVGPRRITARFPWRRGPKGPDLVDVITGLRDELLAGAALRTAFERAVGDEPGYLSGALATCRMGGNVPEALRAAAGREPLLLSLAALWQVSEGSGAALAAALDRLVDAAGDSVKVRAEISAQLAGPRATARVLAVLPLVGVGMGMMMGADPIGFLLGSVWGWGCLVTAVLLEVAGVVWMRRMVASIESAI